LIGKHFDPKVKKTSFKRPSDQRTKCLSELSQLILDVDNRYASSPTLELYKERLLHQSEFDNLSTKQTEQHQFKSRQTFYEHGEKAGKLLSHQLRPEICVAADLTSTNPKEINNQFKQLYSALYSSEALPDTYCLHAFLDNLDITCLNSDEQTNMDASVSDDEAPLAIQFMQSSKA
jgi:hypothetical protein